MSLNLEQMELSGFEPDPNIKWEKIGNVPNVPGPDGVEAVGYNGAFVKSIALDSHRVLIIDQAISSMNQSYVREFDTRTREWSNEEWPSLNQPRNLFSCVLCNGKVYVIGGNYFHGGCLNSIECLDLSASPRQWITMDQGLQTARRSCQCVAIGTQVFTIGGFGDRRNNKLMSVEILNTETSQLVAGPDMPQHKTFAAAAVNNELLVFAQQKPVEGDGYVGRIHMLRQGWPNSTWKMTPCSLQNKVLASEPIVIGDCVVLSRNSVYNTRRNCWWDLPPTPFTCYSQRTVVNETEIVGFAVEGIYSLKLQPSVHPPEATVLRRTKTMYDSLLFSSEFSDVTFVCPDGIEIPAHRSILAADNEYFRTFFGGKWWEQHPDGRWETKKSSNAIKALLSLIYTGEIQLDVTDAQFLELLETAYEFQLNDDLLKVCQAMCIDIINESNVKGFLLLAKPRNATFLFDACFKYVCEHLFEIIGEDPVFAGDVSKVDNGQLWRDIVEAAQRLNRKRPREDSD
jgi:hypothetical protein